MKKVTKYISILSLVFFAFACNEATTKDNKKTSTTQEVETNKTPDILWALKVINPEGQSLDVKAIPTNVKY